MESYERFAQFYDVVMGDQRVAAHLLAELIQAHHPQARKVLELACGTGAVMQHLGKNYDLSGLDLSSKMLAIARKKLPKAKLYHQDMVSFRIPETFDAIFCVFDSINHVLKFSDWKKIFSNVSNHLADGGIFIFDINTQKKLARHVAEPAWIHSFGKNFLVMDVTNAGKQVTNWNIKVFEHKISNQYLLQEETIQEVSFPKEKILFALKKNFRSVKVIDTDKDHPTKKGDRFYFICKK